MTDRILAVAALLVLAAFLGVLIVFVPEIDLTIVIVVVLILAAVDFYLAAFRNRKRGPPPPP